VTTIGSQMSLDLLLAQHANAWAAHHDMAEDAAKDYAGVSEALFVALVALIGLAGLLLRRWRLLRASALALVAAGLSLLVATVVARLVGRPRPFVAHPRTIHDFLPHAADPGFPSDHATAAFAIAIVLLLVLGRWALPVLLLAIALAVSRVLLGVHYPADVIAGALLGSAAAVGVVVAVRHLPDRARRPILGRT
jgi:undecaprenyl-diphosphatase